MCQQSVSQSRTIEPRRGEVSVKDCEAGICGVPGRRVVGLCVVTSRASFLIPASSTKRASGPTNINSIVSTSLRPYGRMSCCCLFE
jgi:hypothetical protein